MSFSEYESSPDRGQPRYLIQFIYSDEPDTVIAMTDHTHPIETGGVRYTPEAVSVDTPAIDGTLDDQQLDIEVSSSSQIATRIRTSPPGAVIRVIVSVVHVSDPDFEVQVSWRGQVMSCSTDKSDGIDTIECSPGYLAIKRPGLTRTYQRSCPHSLYSTACGVLKNSVQISANVISVESLGFNYYSGASATIRIDADLALLRSRYIGGVVEWQGIDGPQSAIILQSPDDLIAGETELVIRQPGERIFEGAQVTVAPGCARTVEACREFNNVKNFGGFPWIPTENPINRSSLF